MGNKDSSLNNNSKRRPSISFGVTLPSGEEERNRKCGDTYAFISGNIAPPVKAEYSSNLLSLFKIISI